jgi:hypothetical protein
VTIGTDRDASVAGASDPLGNVIGVSGGVAVTAVSGGATTGGVSGGVDVIPVSGGLLLAICVVTL